MTVLVTLLIVVGVLLVWRGRHFVKGDGMSEGQIIYMDTHGNGPVVKPLFSRRLGLTGKPDYLLFSIYQLKSNQLRCQAREHIGLISYKLQLIVI